MEDTFKEDMDSVREGGGSVLLFEKGSIFGR
jgi:hypothetical protein